jgi:hypothetical protein
MISSDRRILSYVASLSGLARDGVVVHDVSLWDHTPGFDGGVGVDLDIRHDPSTIGCRRFGITRGVLDDIPGGRIDPTPNILLRVSEEILVGRRIHPATDYFLGRHPRNYGLRLRSGGRRTRIGRGHVRRIRSGGIHLSLIGGRKTARIHGRRT